MTDNKPQQKPKHPYFSSGPTKKYPGWKCEDLKTALVGRSHRSPEAVASIQRVLEKTKDLLNLPADYQLAITPASTTGAFSIGLWSLLGARGVDILVWEVFGKRWATEIQDYLKLNDVRVLEAPAGQIADLSAVSKDRDIVFSWNGTTSGVAVNNAEWIASNPHRLILCDAISTIFITDLPWDKLDFTAFSWQKTLGGESGFGMIVLSPKAIRHLTTYQPTHPIPGILSLCDPSGDIKNGLFQGGTPNTISLLCLEDFLKALEWAESIGGQQGLYKRTEENFAIVESWVQSSSWAGFLAENPLYRSKTSVCLKICDSQFAKLPKDSQWHFIATLSQLLATEQVAYDIKNHRFSAPSLRLWLGPTVEAEDVKSLLPWLDWAYTTTLKSFIDSHQMEGT